MDLMKPLQKLPNGIDAEALALCTMLLDGGVSSNHADVAWPQLWMLCLRLCCWNAAVLWYLGYLLYFFHGSFSDVFCDSRLKLRLAKVNGQTALFYAALQVRVKQIRDSQWAVVVRRDVVWGVHVHLLGNSVAIVSMFTCLSPRVFAPDKGHVETMKYLIAKGADP